MMKIKILSSLASWGLILLIVAALLGVIPRIAETFQQKTVLPPAAPSGSEALIPLAQSSSIYETWELGFTTETANYADAVTGRILGKAIFRSNRGITDTYYIFPAPAVTKTVQSASIFLSRDGAYDGGTANLSLEIFNYAGEHQHTVSAADIDLGTVITGSLQSVSLTGVAAAKEIAPGEFLAFHVNFSDGPGGTLKATLDFQVDVE